MMQKWVWSSLLHKGVLEYSYKIYFINAGHFYKSLQILEVWTNFCYIKQLEKTIKSPGTVLGRKPAAGYSPRGLAACHARPANKPAGSWPSAPIQPRLRPAGGGEVHLESTSKAPGWRRTRRVGVAHTRMAGRRKNSSGQRRSPAGRELRWVATAGVGSCSTGARGGSWG
jgi:hypothetical protein